MMLTYSTLLRAGMIGIAAGIIWVMLIHIVPSTNPVLFEKVDPVAKASCEEYTPSRQETREALVRMVREYDNCLLRVQQQMNFVQRIQGDRWGYVVSQP